MKDEKNAPKRKPGRPRQALAKHRAWRKATIYLPEDLWADGKKRVIDVGGDFSDFAARAIAKALGLSPKHYGLDED